MIELAEAVQDISIGGALVLIAAILGVALVLAVAIKAFWDNA